MVALLLACSPGHQGPRDPGETTTLSWVRPSSAESQLLLDGAEIGRLRRDGERWTLSAGSVSATLERSDAALDAEALIEALSFGARVSAVTVAPLVLAASCSPAWLTCSGPWALAKRCHS